MKTKFAEAVALATSGRFAEAKNLLEEIILEDPKNPDILFNLGMCFTELGQPDKAVVVLNKSIEYSPNINLISFNICRSGSLNNKA